MSRSSLETCSRAWEVAAARDGQLLGKDLDSWRRHLTTCRPCNEEQQRFQALAEGLRNLHPLPDDLLAARRLRHRLLADTHGWVTGNVTAARRAPRVLVLGALVASVLAVLGYVAFSRHAALEPTARAGKTTADGAQMQVEISAQPGSVWRKQALGDELRIELDSGEIRAKIGPRRPGQGVRIQLPDGQIEDLGTILSVAVRDQHTTNLRVEEGRVRVRLDGQDPFELSAGQAWSRTATKPSDAASPEAEPSAVAVVKAEPARRPRSAAPIAAARPATPSASTATDATDVSARAAREEDEAYLHIVALANAHQMADARAAAKAYLLRFPNGFRRAEVLDVATH